MSCPILLRERVVEAGVFAEEGEGSVTFRT